MSNAENTERKLTLVLDVPVDKDGAPAVRLEEQKPGTQVLAFAGKWTLENKDFAEREFTLRKDAALRLDCTGLTDWDSRFLAAVLEIQARLEKLEMAFPADDLPDGARKMLDSMQKSAPPRKSSGSAGSTGLNLKDLFQCEKILAVFAFLGDILLGLWHFLCRKSVTRGKDVVQHIYRTGPTALGIISLISFLMGLILAFIGSIPLKYFSAEIFIASLLGIGILRLMAPVMVGIVMAGRTGAAFAAELGTMVVNEELDAMKTFGIPTFEFLVIPRCVAMMLMLPLLGVFADLVGIAGGLAVGIFYMDLGCEEFFQQLIDTTSLNDLFVGLFTCWVFGFLISVCGCYQGMNCGRNAEAVGKATTSAVVSSIVCIVVATAVITLLTVNLKI